VRAEHYHFSGIRNRFIARRAILRIILGGYLQISPSKMQFLYNSYGRPRLNELKHDEVIEFNLSHSQEFALYIFSSQNRVGIDLEKIHAIGDVKNIIERFFTIREREFINSHDEIQKGDAFFKIWTGKEAFLKAIGTGLSIPMDQVDILKIKNDVANQTSVNENMDVNSKWHIETFCPTLGYQASFAVEKLADSIDFTNNRFYSMRQYV
jgi:4'-phosphopantetheinyl transferase